MSKFKTWSPFTDRERPSLLFCKCASSAHAEVLGRIAYAHQDPATGFSVIQAMRIKSYEIRKFCALLWELRMGSLN